MEELNALVNYSAGHMKRAPSRLCRGCDIDGVHVECSFSTCVPGGKAIVLPNTNCLLCSEARMCARPLTQSILAIVPSLKAYCGWREEHPAVYDAAMDRITRWAPKFKYHLERAAAKDKGKHKKQQREYSAGYKPRLCLEEKRW